jgi:peptidoglycan/xylan/chitin deacetylase (PgdA/CDA1 family)
MGQEIGSHTMSHMRVSAHEQNKVHQDLDLSRQLLLKNCGQAEHFAWPYGLFSDFNSAGVKSVFELGYQSCSSAERGAHISTGVPVKKEELCIRRDHIVLDWKPSHIQYFLRKSAAQSSAQHNLFPY